jgi:methionyl-tRNA synthetase
MIKRYRGGVVPQSVNTGEAELALQRLADETRRQAGTALDAWDLGSALGIIWNLVRRANQYIEQNEPWKLAKRPEQAEKLDTVLYTAAEATRILAILLAPFIPDSADKILAQLGQPAASNGDWSKLATWGSVTLERVVPGEVVFPRFDAEVLVEA